MKANSCEHAPTVLLTSILDGSIKFAVCSDDKKDSLFDTGFTVEELLQ